MSNIIETEKLCYEYSAASSETERVKALEDVDLSVQRGTFTVILGMNGSGKSTLARCMNALLIPTSGAVYVEGMDTSDPERLWDIRRTAGMVFQNPDNQLVSTVVEDDVAFGPENLGVPTEKIREQIDAAMKAAGIYEQRLRTVHSLSGGQKQRTAVAGVLAMNPRCVIFDESTAMLDPKGRGEIMQVIDRLLSEGITAVLITHFMDEAVKADRVVLMKEGRIVSEGNPAEVFADEVLIKECGLDLPHGVKIRNMLRTAGFQIPDHILDIDGLAEWLKSEGGTGDEDRD